MPFIEDIDDIVSSSVSFGVKPKNEYLWVPFQEEIDKVEQHLSIEALETVSFEKESIYYGLF